MKRQLIEELADVTTMEDIADAYKPVVELIGLDNVLKLSEYSMGDKIYFPKVERILAPARNRKIRQDYNGYNSKDLATVYDLTTNQIMQIVRDMDPMQISMFDLLETDE